MEIMLRATVVFFFVWGLMRIMGKRELSELTAFELVLLISIGDLIQQGITQEDMSVTGAMLAVGTIAAWIMAFSFVSFRWRRTRPVLEGSPVLVVHQGQVLERPLHVERITVEELKDAAREQGVEDLSDVRYGILEANGRFSFITGERHRPPERLAD